MRLLTCGTPSAHSLVMLHLDTMIAFALASLSDSAQFESLATMARAARPLTEADLSITALDIECCDRIVEARKIAATIRSLRLF